MATTEDANDLGGLEKSLEELEALVARLESGDLPLEQALKEFEHGVKLTRQCQTALQAAEQKVEILLKKTASAEPSAFTASSDERAPPTWPWWPRLAAARSASAGTPC